MECFLARGERQLRVLAQGLPPACAIALSPVLLEAEGAVFTFEYVDALRSILGFERDKNGVPHCESWRLTFDVGGGRKQAQRRERPAATVLYQRQDIDGQHSSLK
jgi:hypothetical protein